MDNINKNKKLIDVEGKIYYSPVAAVKWTANPDDDKLWKMLNPIIIKKDSPDSVKGIYFDTHNIIAANVYGYISLPANIEKPFKNQWYITKGEKKDAANYKIKKENVFYFLEKIKDSVCIKNVDLEALGMALQVISRLVCYNEEYEKLNNCYLALFDGCSYEDYMITISSKKMYEYIKPFLQSGIKYVDIYIQEKQTTSPIIITPSSDYLSSVNYDITEAIKEQAFVVLAAIATHPSNIDDIYNLSYGYNLRENKLMDYSNKTEGIEMNLSVRKKDVANTDKEKFIKILNKTFVYNNKLNDCLPNEWIYRKRPIIIIKDKVAYFMVKDNHSGYGENAFYEVPCGNYIDGLYGYNKKEGLFKVAELQRNSDDNYETKTAKEAAEYHLEKVTRDEKTIAKVYPSSNLDKIYDLMDDAKRNDYEYAIRVIAVDIKDQNNITFNLFTTSNVVRIPLFADIANIKEFPYRRNIYWRLYPLKNIQYFKDLQNGFTIKEKDFGADTVITIKTEEYSVFFAQKQVGGYLTSLEGFISPLNTKYNISFQNNDIRLVRSGNRVKKLTLDDVYWLTTLFVKEDKNEKRLKRLKQLYKLLIGDNDFNNNIYGYEDEKGRLTVLFSTKNNNDIENWFTEQLERIKELNEKLQGVNN